MVPYTGEEINDCQSFLHKYSYQSHFYFRIDNYCANIIPHYLSCDNISIRPESPEFQVIEKGAEYLGIVGISKKGSL